MRAKTRQCDQLKISGWRPIFLAAVAACSLASCTGNGALQGPPVEMNAADVDHYRINQEAMLASLSRLAGLGGGLPPPGDARWTDIADAGINYSDLQCERFISAIFEWHRKGETAKQELSLIGSTTTTVLSLVNVSQKAMGLTAAAFGLASGTLNNIENSVLFKVEPSRVRETVEGLQAEYYAVVQKSQYTTQAATVATIAHYHAICLPANIEAELNQKIGGAPSEVAKGRGRNGAPIVGSPDTIATVQKMTFTYVTDDAREIIEKTIFADAARTKFDTAAVARFRECLKQVGYSGLITDFLHSPAHANDRITVANCLTGG